MLMFLECLHADDGLGDSMTTVHDSEMASAARSASPMGKARVALIAARAALDLVPMRPQIQGVAQRSIDAALLALDLQESIDYHLPKQDAQ